MYYTGLYIYSYWLNGLYIYSYVRLNSGKSVGCLNVYISLFIFPSLRAFSKQMKTSLEKIVVMATLLHTNAVVNLKNLVNKKYLKRIFVYTSVRFVDRNKFSALCHNYVNFT